MKNLSLQQNSKKKKLSQQSKLKIFISGVCRIFA